MAEKGRGLRAACRQAGDVTAQRPPGARPARGHEGSPAPPHPIGRSPREPGGRSLGRPRPFARPRPGGRGLVRGAWPAAAAPPALLAPPRAPPPRPALAPPPPGPGGGALGRPATPPPGHAHRGAGPAPRPIQGEGGHAASGPGHAPSGGGHAPPGGGHAPSGGGHAPRGAGHAPFGGGRAPPPARGGGGARWRPRPERAGGGRGGAGLPLPLRAGTNPDQPRQRRGRGRGGATPPGGVGHAPSGPGHAPRGAAQPPPAGGARDLRAEHPGRVPAGLREPHPRQRRRGRGEARGHFPAGVQHPPEAGLGAAAAPILPAPAGLGAAPGVPRQLQTPRAHHGRPADPLRPQLAQRPGDEHVRGPGDGRRARQGAFLQLLLLRQTAHARLRGRPALDQERGHLRQGAAADPHPPGGSLVAGGRGRGAPNHHLLRLPAHPQPPLPQAHLPLPPGRGGQEGAAGFPRGLAGRLQNERGPAEQRQRLRRLRAAVLQIPGAGPPVQLHAAGHAPPAPPDVQGALPLPARPLTPKIPGIPPQFPNSQNPPKTPEKTQKTPRKSASKWAKNENFSTVWAGLKGGGRGLMAPKILGIFGIPKNHKNSQKNYQKNKKNPTEIGLKMGEKWEFWKGVGGA